MLSNYMLIHKDQPYGKIKRGAFLVGFNPAVTPPPAPLI